MGLGGGMEGASAWSGARYHHPTHPPTPLSEPPQVFLINNPRHIALFYARARVAPLP